MDYTGIQHTTGVILSGGRSSRMKENKALAEINGEKIIRIVAVKMMGAFKDTMLVTNRPAEYEDIVPLKIRRVMDIIPGKGPLSGIHASLRNTENPSVFAVACDMPFVSVDFAAYMCARAAGRDAVVPRMGDYFQPLCAVYTQRCLPVLEDALIHDRLKISRLFEELNIQYIEEEEIRRFGSPDVMFHNINAQEDLTAACRLAVEEGL